MDENIKNRLSEAGVDLKTTMERFINNEAFYLKFLLRFPADPNYAALTAAMAEKNMEEIERSAHTLKGVSANLGLDPVAEVLGEMVRAVRTGRTESLDGQFESLKERYQMFCEIIKQIPAQ